MDRRILEQFYRYLRHGMRVQITFVCNYLLLRRLRKRLSRGSPERKMIAVMLLEHLGDIVACEPVARHIRQENPDAYIIWMVKKDYRELIDNNTAVDKTVIVHCLSERLMLSESGIFDRVIDLHFHDRHCSLCRKPIKKGRDASTINLTNYFQYGSLLSAMSQSAGLPALDDKPRVYVPRHSIAGVDALRLPGEFIVINCTSNADEKGWPREKWERLLREIKERCSLPVFEVGLTPLIDGSSGICSSLCGELSILECAEVIRRARLFIGIDSGPAHLANAVGTAGVILIGRYLGFTNYIPFSGPYGKGENVQIVYAEGPAADIPVDNVGSAVRKMLGSSSR